MQETVKAQIPEKLAFLFKPSRYKVLKGGRGGAKSWSIARVLLILASATKLNILCARETQKSIKQSVHKLLSEQIKKLGLSHLYHITNNYIECTSTGSTSIFEGLRQNIADMKSFEGVDICWVEEAHKVLKDSWEVLTPTIREPNSEIWISYNPEYEDDATHQRWCVHAPDNAIVIVINYWDNPWFPEVLEKERQQDKARLDKDSYENKWEGKCKGIGRKVWAGFTKKVHLKTFDRKLMAAEANCFMGMDPHSHYYPFCAWVAIIPKNKRRQWPEDFHKHIYAEWPTVADMGGYYHDMRKKVLFQGTMLDISREIYAKDGIEHGIKIYNRFIDTRYAKGSGSWNWSTKTEGVVIEFAKKGNGGLLFTRPREKIMDAQKDVIKKDLEWNRLVPISEFNEPAFSVDPSCRNTIMSFENHRLEESSESESEKYKEPSDVARIIWAGLNMFKYIDPTPQPPSKDRPAPGGRSWMG